MLPTRTAVVTLGFRAEALPVQSLLTLDRGLCCTRISAFLEALSSGKVVGSISYLVDGGGGVAATGTVTFSSASGTVGATINGVAVTVTASGGDTATAAAFAAAVNNSANPLVNLNVTATSVAGVATLTSRRQDASGNQTTLAATGTGVTVSGARLTGGTNPTDNTVIV